MCLMEKMPVKKHPLNENFSWQQPPPPFEIITDEQARDYQDIGGFVLEQAFTPEELAPLVAELDVIEAEVNEQIRSQPQDQPTITRPDEIVFSAHVVSRSETAKAFAAHDVFKKLCHDLIGPRARLYWDQLVYKRPKTEAEFPWHQDNGYTFVEPQQYLTCWLALNDATVDNGCPWIAPGMHHTGTLAHVWTDLGFQCFDTHENAQAMPLSAGSIAVFSSLTPHRTGPNLTNGIRRAYILQYAPDGALIIPRQGAEVGANDPDRQFMVCE